MRMKVLILQQQESFLSLYWKIIIEIKLCVIKTLRCCCNAVGSQNQIYVLNIKYSVYEWQNYEYVVLCSYVPNYVKSKHTPFERNTKQIKQAWKRIWMDVTWEQGSTPTTLQRQISARSLALMWHGWTSAQCQRHRSNWALGWLGRLARYGRALRHYRLSGIQMGLHHLPRGIRGGTIADWQLKWRENGCRDQDWAVSKWKTPSQHVQRAPFNVQSRW